MTDYPYETVSEFTEITVRIQQKQRSIRREQHAATKRSNPIHELLYQ